MAETRPPTPNEMRWAIRKLNQLMKSHEELTARVVELEEKAKPKKRATKAKAKKAEA